MTVLMICLVCRPITSSWAWELTPVLLALGKLRLKDCEFQASLGYLESLLKTTKKPPKKLSQTALKTMRAI
jgi:hypothetical protein